jgi:hypothetical protein
MHEQVTLSADPQAICKEQNILLCFCLLNEPHQRPADIVFRVYFHSNYEWKHSLETMSILAIKSKFPFQQPAAQYCTPERVCRDTAHKFYRGSDIIIRSHHEGDELSPAAFSSQVNYTD